MTLFIGDSTPCKFHLQSRISICCHKWVQSLLTSALTAQHITPWGVSISEWWALLAHVCASVTVLSKCHIPSPVWSLGQKKMNQKYWLYIEWPMGNMGTFYGFYKGNIFYLLTSYYLNRQYICLINILYFLLTNWISSYLWKYYAHSSLFC